MFVTVKFSVLFEIHTELLEIFFRQCSASTGLICSDLLQQLQERLSSSLLVANKNTQMLLLTSIIPFSRRTPKSPSTNIQGLVKNFTVITLFSSTLSPYLSLGLETSFHSHTKQMIDYNYLCFNITCSMNRIHKNPNWNTRRV